MSTNLVLCWTLLWCAQRPAPDRAVLVPSPSPPRGSDIYERRAESSQVHPGSGLGSVRFSHRHHSDRHGAPVARFSRRGHRFHDGLFLGGLGSACAAGAGLSPIGCFPPPPFFPAYDGFGPLVIIPEPVILLPPPEPAADVRPVVPFMPALPRGGTMDIPPQLVDDLIGRRRPTLTQRALSAKLEGGGDRLFRAGHFSRAAERYEQALAQTPEQDELSFKRGEALLAAGQYDAAGRVIRDALRERPDWPYVDHDLRQLFPDDASIARLLEHLEREMQKPSADPDLLFLGAYVLYFSGQRQAAEPIFRNPPEGGPTAHFSLFLEAMERQRNNERDDPRPQPQNR